MRSRSLTKKEMQLMRKVAYGADIFMPLAKRFLAINERFPGLMKFVSPAGTYKDGAEPYFGVILTPAGLRAVGGAHDAWPIPNVEGERS